MLHKLLKQRNALFITLFIISGTFLLQWLWADGTPVVSYTQSELEDALTYLEETGNTKTVTIVLGNGSTQRITLNPSVYLTYNKVVYEGPHDDFKNKAEGEKTLKPFIPKWKNNSGTPGEYRYLGLDIKGNTIYNEDFPKDFVSPKKLEDKDWDRVEDNRKIWYKMTGDNYAIVAYILSKKVIDDGQLTDYSLMDILKNKTTDPNEALFYIQLQSLPTFYADGVVKLTHMKGAYYDTFNIPRFSLNIKAVLKLKDQSPDLLDSAISDHTVTLTLDGSESSCVEDSDVPKILPLDSYTFEVTHSFNTAFDESLSAVTRITCATQEEAKSAALTLSGVKAGDDLLCRLTVVRHPGLSDTVTLLVDLKTTTPPPTVTGVVQLLSYDGAFNPLLGIPTHEKLKIFATLDDRAQTLSTTRMEGVKTYPVEATRVYTLIETEEYEHGNFCEDSDGDGVKDSCPGHIRTTTSREEVTKTVLINRDYSYYQIQQLFIGGFETLRVMNVALPEGSQSLTASDYRFLTPTVCFDHSTDEKDHIKAPDLSVTLSPKTVRDSIPNEDFTAEADGLVGQIEVRNDGLTVDATVVMDDLFYSRTAPAPLALPAPKTLTLDSNLAKREPLLPGHLDPANGYPIPISTLNATYDSSASASYKPLASVGPAPIKPAPLTANAVAVHTPVVCNITLYPQLDFDQRVAKDDSRVGLVLDAPFSFSFKTTGQHRAILGYGNRDYKDYTKNKSVLIPFDVYVDDSRTTLVRGGTWMELDPLESDFEFFIPSWVEEGTYTLSFKSKPENFPEGRTMKGQVYANLAPDSYNAYQTAPVEVSGRLYDLRIHNITDSLWSQLFYKLRPAVQVGEVFFTGIRDKNGQLQTNRPLTLPIMPGKHPEPGYQNLGLKLGYAFMFDIKSLGQYYGTKDYLRITPRFYHLDATGQNRQEVDLYYHQGNQYFIQVGSDRDTFDRYLMLDNPLLLTLRDQMLQTAADNEALGIQTRTQTLRDYSLSTFIGRAYRIVLSKGLRYAIGNDSLCPIADPEVKRRARMHTQKWFGYYALPSTTLAVPKGTDLSQVKGTMEQNSHLFLTEGYIVVNFDHIALYHNQDFTKPILQYSTDTLNEWNIEGYTVGQNGYDIRLGDVCLYQAGDRATDDYTTGVTH